MVAAAFAAEADRAVAAGEGKFRQLKCPRPGADAPGRFSVCRWTAAVFMASRPGISRGWRARALCRLVTVYREWQYRRYKVVGENIQLKGRIRSSFILDTFPFHPQFGLSQEIFSFPNISIASISESDGFEHFRCRLML